MFTQIHTRARRLCSLVNKTSLCVHLTNPTMKSLLNVGQRGRILLPINRNQRTKIEESKTQSFPHVYNVTNSRGNEEGWKCCTFAKYEEEHWKRFFVGGWGAFVRFVYSFISQSNFHSTGFYPFFFPLYSFAIKRKS